MTDPTNRPHPQGPGWGDDKGESGPHRHGWGDSGGKRDDNNREHKTDPQGEGL